MGILANENSYGRRNTGGCNTDSGGYKKDLSGYEKI
jgi:hypothetical protein